MKSVLKSEFVVVGGGPVGLAAAMLLQKFKIAHVVLEKNSRLGSHPGSYWLSMRTREIFDEVPRLNELIDKEQHDLKQMTHYRLVESVLGKEHQKQNLFQPSFQEKMRWFQRFSNKIPAHISQSRLTALMLQCMKQDNVQLSTRVIDVTKNQSDGVTLKALKNQTQNIEVHAKYVIACDGVDSTIRKDLKISMEGFPIASTNKLCIHFTSAKLALLLQKFGQLAMLHLIYNHHMRGTLVNHNYKNGQFVLQIPTLGIPLQQMFSPEELVKKSIQHQFFEQLNDLKIQQVSQWKTTGQVASQFSQGDVFLAGDAAHSFPQPHGLGLNIGIQDVHNLIHKFNTAKKNTEMQANPKVIEKELLRYGIERKRVAKDYMARALKDHQAKDALTKQMGFATAPNLTSRLLKFTPGRSTLYNVWMRSQYMPKTISRLQLPLIEAQQFQIDRLSRYREQIQAENNKNTNICYFMDSKSKREDFPQLLGVQDDSIKKMQLTDEKLVRSDGIVLY